MASPRLPCLSTSRHIMRKASAARARFSTSQASKDDEPPRRPSAASDLLKSITSKSAPGSPRDPFETITSIQLPRRSARPPPGSALTGGSPSSSIVNLINKANTRAQAREPTTPGRSTSSAADEMTKHRLGQDLSKQIPRRWRAGDVYAPRDVGLVEAKKWKRRRDPNRDVFDVLDIKPMEQYSNFAIMSEYMTPMGRIKHSKETGLRPVNQRRIARAIRRSIGMGIMPSVHRHPELLRAEVVKRNTQLSAYRSGPL